ncbi:MAG TPA: mercuric reductase [Gemmatimonadales bacterium]|nr:mercuric reductase [Gemmatimonadales bacterium]
MPLPSDQYDRQLAANVRPADWTNPDPRQRYHLVVIGAGPGGLMVAAIAAGLGARVALIERHRLGGDCLNAGCVPSKALIAAARSWRVAADSSRDFGGPRTVGTGDFATAMQRMRRLRAELSRADSAARYRDLGVDVFLGEGAFTGRDAVSVAGRVLRFRRAVIASGSRAAIPRVPGLEGTGYLTNETVLDLAQLPRHLVVLGAGPNGCEMGQAFARFGSRVTLVEEQAHILPGEDPDAARVVGRALEGDGVRLLVEARVLRADPRGSTRVLQVQRDGRTEEIAADQVLLAAGRVPNVEGLGLEAAGVAFGPRGIRVDDRLRTSNRRIFAIGDVCSQERFTHVADAQARLVVGNALFFGLGGGDASRLIVPRVTYTSPEVAHVGRSLGEAAGAGYRVDTITVPFEAVDRAVLDGQNGGFLRVHLQRGRGRILGATLVAEHAGEMIGELALAVTAGVGLGAIGSTIRPYPTQGEAIRKVADAWRRARLTPRAKRGFERFFRILR